MIFEEHQTGMLDCLGQMWTWVTADSPEAGSVSSLIGLAGLMPYLDGRVGLRPYLAGEVGLVPYTDGLSGSRG